MNKLNIKFIGGGRVVKEFFSAFPSTVNQLNAEIYDLPEKMSSKTSGIKTKNLSDFETEETIVFLCASVSEKKILNQLNSKRRIDVAGPNLKIVKELISKGHFDKGLIFVLTNPSDLIAEYIFKSTKNKNVFALGPFYDSQRYKELCKFLNSDPKLPTLLGQHYQDPIAQLNEIDPLLLQVKYQEDVEKEFHLQNPPHKSGAQNINNVVSSLGQKGKIQVSGYDKASKSFLCGFLNLSNMKFISNKPRNHQEYSFLTRCLNHHYKNYENLVGVIS